MSRQPPSNLLDLIRTRIDQHGPMDLGEYMSLCLGHPQFGYYMTRDPFGVDGDFTTAPEISQMFGEMIGAWLADLWIKMGRPTPFALVECGPGRGTLMADALRSTKHVVGFHSAIKLFLMEMSPVLKDVQRQHLGLYDPVWIDDLSQLPASIPVLLVGNEFLDALPIRQVVYRNGEWREKVVALDHNDALCIGEKQADISLIEHISRSVKFFSSNDVFEVSPILNHYIKSVDILLKKQSGAALFLDYGHVESSAGETLQAVRSHRFVSIFDTPGQSDLTAHVDFENIRTLAEKDGLSVVGPITQERFLNNLGIEMRAGQIFMKANDAQKADIQNALERLLSPDQMGTLFKVMALCHDETLIPAGF